MILIFYCGEGLKVVLKLSEICPMMSKIVQFGGYFREFFVECQAGKMLKKPLKTQYFGNFTLIIGKEHRKTTWQTG
jgi:hypothetical protein